MITERLSIVIVSIMIILWFLVGILIGRHIGWAEKPETKLVPYYVPMECPPPGSPYTYILPEKGDQR